MKHNKYLGGLTLLLASFFVLMIFAQPAVAASKMPSFLLPDAVTGENVDSKNFAGKTLLVTFFATWCPPCMQEVPDLINLQKKYSSKGFSVIALSVDEGGAKVVKKLVEKRSINYPVLMADRSTAQSFGGVVGIPTSFLINSKGNVVKKYPGYVPHVLLENDIKKIMN
ncbi:MAG TPA: TlpA family protein disulfide reductase [Desulfobacterales bacterium]|nr:TlpA family protein disulfide reductase [Desulfobacterales bacterium]